MDAVVPALAQARTYLFVPGTLPERFGKALSSGAARVAFGTLDFAPNLDRD